MMGLGSDGFSGIPLVYGPYSQVFPAVNYIRGVDGLMSGNSHGGIPKAVKAERVSSLKVLPNRKVVFQPSIGKRNIINSKDMLIDVQVCCLI